MVAKRTSRAPSATGHAGRPGSVRQRGHILHFFVSTESDEAMPRDERYGGGGINGVYEINCVRTEAHTDSGTCTVEVLLCCEGVFLICNCQGKEIKI